MAGIEHEAAALSSEAAGSPGAEYAAWKRELDQAASLVLLEEWEEASFRYFVLASDPAGVGKPERREALWWLAESLYRSDNPVAARPWYEELATDLSADYGHDAAARAVEIASKEGDDAAVEAAWSRFVQGNPGAPLDPTVGYALGKSLYHQGDLERADLLFGRFPLEGPRGRQAAYFRAVIALRRKRIAEAEAAFRALALLPVKNPEEQAILDQATLSLARLLSERGVYREAAEVYGRVSEKSRSHPEALYEGAWALVKAGRSRAGLDQCDLFLVSYPDHPLTARVKLLRGRALLGAGEDEEARESYKGFAAEYAAVPARLTALLAIATRSDPATFLASLGASEGSKGVARSLPQPAAQAVLARPEVARAVGITASLSQEERSLEDARTLEISVSGALTGAEAAGLPDANGRRRRVDELELRTDAARVEILTSAFPGDPHLPELRAALQAVRVARKGSETARVAERASLARLRSQALALSAEVDGERARAVALAKYARDSAGDDREIAAAAAETNAELKALDQRTGEIASLLRELKAREAATFSLRPGPAERESQAALGRILEGVEGSTGPVDPALSVRLRRLAEVGRSLSRSRETISRVEKEKLERAGVVLAECRLALSAEGHDLTRASVHSYAAAAGAVGRGLKAEAASFDSLILRSDLGSLDVAWERKDKESRRIDLILGERDRALEELDRRWAPILQTPGATP